MGGLRISFVFSALLALGAASDARSFDADVSHVTDGDTLWVRPVSGGPPRKVRLDGIDAPELCQPHGPASRQALVKRVLRRRVVVDVHGEDSFGRALARVSVDGQDVGTWMVSRGHAWSYRFRRDAGPYAAQQAKARQARAGLWASAKPLEPRAFRSAKPISCAAQPASPR